MRRTPSTERILLVEDNALLAENIAELLSDEGYEVIRCERAEQVEQALAERSADLALVDISLRGKESGLELLPRLRRLSPLGEIMLMTGNASLHTAMEAIRSGVYAYLPKPFAPDELLAIARRALAQVALKRERQALSERLALSEALYRSVVETVETCILGLNQRGQIAFVNRFAADRLGPTAEGAALDAHVDERGRRDLAHAFQKLRSGHSVRDLDISHLTPSGVRIVRWTFTPLHAIDASLARRAVEAQLELPNATLLAVGHDITDRLELERRSAASQAMAAVGTLTTSLAHEIRNPLNAAKLQLELIQRRAKRAASPELATKLAEPATLVRSELERLTKMLDEFLSLARPSMPVKVSTSVASLFDAVVTLEAPVAERAGLTIACERMGCELSVPCDPEKIKQALLNLTRNSIDAMSERGHGHIALSAERSADGFIMLNVSDDGPGLAREMLGEAAFEAFATTKAGGTGLGLSIVQKLVAQHNGQVELTNRPEGGTLARLRLPA